MSLLASMSLARLDRSTVAIFVLVSVYEFYSYIKASEMLAIRSLVVPNRRSSAATRAFPWT